MIPDSLSLDYFIQVLRLLKPKKRVKPIFLLTSTGGEEKQKIICRLPLGGDSIYLVFVHNREV